MLQYSSATSIMLRSHASHFTPPPSISHAPYYFPSELHGVPAIAPPSIEEIITDYHYCHRDILVTFLHDTTETFDISATA